MSRPPTRQQRFEIECQGLIYQTPLSPPIEEVRGIHLPKKDQVWYRREEYLEYDWNVDPEAGDLWYNVASPEQWKLFDEEIERIHVGDWIMINGIPTYFNPDCYFFHQWFTLLIEDIHPKYKETSLEYYQFVELCEDDPLTLGDCGIKGRRVGLSSMRASRKLRIAVVEDNTLSGIVSKTGTDAYEMYLMVKNGLEKLPGFLTPELAKVTDKEIHIAKQTSRISKHNKLLSADKGKNNRVNWLDTAENAYDGRRMRDVVIDECLSPETNVLCEGNIFRPVKDINIGDKVIVEGGNLVEVAKKFEGYDEMYLVEQSYAKNYVVSSKHRLYLEQRCKNRSIKDDGIKYHTPVEYLKLDNYRKRCTHGLRSSGVEFTHSDMLIDPYILGAWLGDGRCESPVFICNFVDEPELIAHLIDYGKKSGYDVIQRTVSGSKKVIEVGYTRPKKTGKYNPFNTELKRLGIYGNKRIPQEYFQNSIESRFKLLAGIIDTDGHCDRKKSSICVCLSNYNLVNDVYNLAKSIGLSVSEIRYAKSNFNTNSFKISISGDLASIPTLVKRKNFAGYKQQYKFRRNKIDVKPIGVGAYVGIQVKSETDDNRRLILEDYTLTMNCAKWERVNVQICLSKISDTLLVGGSVGGYVSIFSTVNKGDKGGDNFKKIWDGSDHSKAVNGMTATRLKRFFIAGYKGFYGYIGKYGESIINTPTPEQREYLESFIDPSTGKRACPDPTIGSREWLDRLRKLVENDPELLAEQIRKYPYVWQEVFKGSNNRCNFDLEALNEHIVDMEAEAERLGLKEMGRQGRFTKRSNGEKGFEDTKAGFWHILEFLKPGDDNKVIYMGNIKCPNNGAFGCAGLDPFAHSKLALEDGSDACIIIMKRYDALDPECSYMPIAMFLGRPNTKPDFFDQLYFGLEYYGIKVLGERAPTDWIDYAKDKKVRLATEDEDAPKKVGFLMCTKRANGSEVYGINPQDKEAREQHLTEMVEYAKFNLKKIKFIALLKDMVNFDFSNRTAYDACMAFGYALMGLKDWQKIEKVDVKAKLFMKNKRSKSYFQNMGRKDKAA